MANQPGTLEQIAIGLARAIARLTDRLNDEEFPDTLARLGIVFPPALLTDPAVVAARNGLITAAGQLPASIDELIAAAQAEDLRAIIQRGLKLLTDVNALIRSFNNLPNALNAVRGAFPGIGDAEFAEFAAGFARNLLDLLIADFLDEVPAVGAALTLVGLFERVQPFVTADSELLEIERTKIHYERIAKLLGTPEDYFRTIYDWGSPTFDGTKLLPALSEFLARLDVPTAYRGAIEETTTLLQAYVLDIIPNTAIDPPGLDISIVAPFGGSINESFALPNPAWRGSFSAMGRFGTVLTGRVRPPLNFSVASPTASFEGEAKVNLIGEATKPLVILGQAGGNRIEVKTIKFGAGVKFSTTAGASGAEPLVEGDLEGGRIIIDGSSGDGFISKVLSGVKIDSSFNVGLAWNLSTGLRFDASSTLTIMLPVHAELGPFSVTEIFLVGTLEGEKILFELSVSLAAKFGPLQAVVKQIGIMTDITFPDAGGNAGPALIHFAFKPPKGVGLSVDAGIIKGGGYLDFDFDREEYSGILELSLAGIVTVKAIGLITTKMPDGSKGFSLLLIITAEFGTGIQLSFGFTLLGVGGLMGLNRTMMLEPLASGIKTGAINSIMFPPDPIANAPRIISDLRAYFPPYEGKFLIGPMIKLGWGTPTLISIAFGLIIEIPGNIAIVGVLRIALPEATIPIVTINVAFVGAIEFDRKRIWFFAALFDSRILFMTLEGDMGLLMDFGNDPNFVLSVGGFHPQFNPPPLPFPNPRRIHLDVLRTPVARITVENYFAITTNTVQFGCRAEFFYGVSAFNLHGHFSFDALFQFSPFRFQIDITFSLGMDVFGLGVFTVRLKFRLSGPAPWNARGTATLSIDLWLFSIDISVDFDITWGEADNPKLPAIKGVPLLVTEFGKPDNWVARIPANVDLLVSLRKLDTTTEKLVLHPVGTLAISQKRVPLGIRIDKVGNNPVDDAHLFAVNSASPGLVKKAAAKDRFAIAQYQDMSDADKLTRPAFQEIEAGVELAFDGKQLGSSKVTKRIVRYEVKVNDIDGKHHAFRWFDKIGTLFFHWLGGAAVSYSDLSFARKKAMVPTTEAERIRTKPPRFVVAGVANNKPFVADVFLSEAHAQDFLSAKLASDPAMIDELHVIPNFESK